jgi:hypothetical protein
MTQDPKIKSPIIIRGMMGNKTGRVIRLVSVSSFQNDNQQNEKNKYECSGLHATTIASTRASTYTTNWITHSITTECLL